MFSSKSRTITLSVLVRRPTATVSVPFSRIRRYSWKSPMAQERERVAGGECHMMISKATSQLVAATGNVSDNVPGKPLNFGIVLFPAFQALDVFGPLDALNLLARSYDMNLYTIAETLDPVSTKQDTTHKPATTDSDFGQRIVPTHTFQTAPPLDVLIIPGGQGTRYPGISTTIDFVRERFGSLQYLLTVCTGSGVAARAGVLDGRRATTNKLSWQETIALRPEVDWVHKARWVQDGHVWTSSGISAGIDLTFAWIGAVYGKDIAKNIANRMEYTPVEDPSWDPFAELWDSKK